ncbi:hypothetical protein [Clostridium peptidivorans]|uniref:hypothetical protein n=1 Tax=Clostridium peptidivorans TaxID=100174 RepID=UPI0011779B51|nr:hypothetical protein [Clostridium peptidivorans]
MFNIKNVNQAYWLNTVNGPAFNPPPVPPTKLQYASWPTSNIHAFNYETTGISTDDDSALLNFWGDNEENAFLIPPGETVVVRILLYTPVQVPPASRGLQLSPVK